MKDIKSKYTWHHLDDYDPINNTCTMQLVLKDIHKATTLHIGSVGRMNIPQPKSSGIQIRVRDAAIQV